MSVRKALLWTAIAAAASVFPAAAAYSAVVEVQVAPPAPIYEPVPAARHGYVWAPGYWQWNGYRHVWVRGHWEGERYSQMYIPDRWVATRDGYWHRAPGHWDYPYNRYGAWDDRRYEIYGGWDGRHRDHYSYNEDGRGYLRFDR